MTVINLGSGQKHEVTFPITIFAGAPPVPTYGTAIARPAKPDLDTERNIVDNIARPGGTVVTTVPPASSTRGDHPHANPRSVDGRPGGTHMLRPR